MSNDPSFPATTRPENTYGTKRSRRLRQDGLIPGNIYGHKLDAVSFTISAETLTSIVHTGHKVVEFELDGAKPEKAMIQNVQWDVFSQEILHVELLRVDADERVKVTVPIVLKGVAAGVLGGGIMEQPHHSIEIDCPAIRIPDNILVKINDLQIGDAIHVKELNLPEGVVPHYPPEEMIVHIVAPKGAKDSDEATEDTGSEPEVLTAKKEE